jgi:hypothetical protein
MMYFNLLTLTTMCFIFTLNSATYFEGLDDTILHKIDWAGPLIELEENEVSPVTVLVV